MMLTSWATPLMPMPLFPLGADRPRGMDSVAAGDQIVIRRVAVGFGRCGVGADEAFDAQPGVLQSPELAEEGVVRDRVEAVVAVALGEEHGRVHLEFADRLARRLPRLGLDQLEAATAEVRGEVDVGFLTGRPPLHRARARGPLDDHPVGEKVAAGAAESPSRTRSSSDAEAIGAARSAVIVVVASVWPRRGTGSV